MLIPFQWIGLFATATVFAVMFALGLMLGREQIAAALQRRVVLAAVVFAVVVPVPALAVLALKVFALKGPVAVGIMLMAISPGAPVALRRALDAGGNRAFAPALHLAIVMTAVLTVPASVAVLDWIFAADFTVTPFDIGRQVFLAQLLPMALGATLRAFLPALAAKLEAPLGRVGNALLLLLAIAVVVDLPSIIAAVGWVPTIAGVAMTVCALAVGAAFAWRDAEVRPAAAVAAAMRNPGLALVIATVNRRAARRDGCGDRLCARPGGDDGGVRAVEQAAAMMDSDDHVARRARRSHPCDAPDGRGGNPAGVRSVSADARYMRFMHTVREPNLERVRKVLASFPESGLGIVATVPAADGIDIVGTAMFVIGGDPATCEFAITIAADYGGAGLGARCDRAHRRGETARTEGDGGLRAGGEQADAAARARVGFSVARDPDDAAVRLPPAPLDRRRACPRRRVQRQRRRGRRTCAGGQSARVRIRIKGLNVSEMR